MDRDFVRGTCQTMCPLEEARLRQKENLLHKFEMKKGTERNRRPEYDPNKIVKSFGRSAAGVETTNPSSLRPFSVLLKTIEYLYLEIFPLHKDNPLVVYDFMFDRFRAVRQDAVIQNLSCGETIQILEPIVKFLIFFGYLLADEQLSVFDPQINSTHLQECMKRLLVCYNELENSVSTRWEIESAYLLFNLGNLKALTRGVNLSQSKTDESYLYSLELSLQWYLKNYFKVFKMITNLSPLHLCVISKSIADIRKYTLHALCIAYSSANCSYPVSRLKDLMLFDNENQVVIECNCFNIKVSNGKINFLKKDFDSGAKCKTNVRMMWIDDKVKELAGLLYSSRSVSVEDEGSCLSVRFNKR